jgi:hypothetical protein
MFLLVDVNNILITKSFTLYQHFQSTTFTEISKEASEAVALRSLTGAVATTGAYCLQLEEAAIRAKVVAIVGNRLHPGATWFSY